MRQTSLARAMRRAWYSASIWVSAGRDSSKKRLEGGVRGPRVGADAQPPHYAAGVFVYDENGFSSGVEEDAVGGLLADAVDGEEFGPEGVGILGEHGVQVSTMSSYDMVCKCLYPAGFDGVEAGGADEIAYVSLGKLGEGGYIQRTGTSEGGEGFCGIGPGGRLDQNGADNHFERGVGGPPVLGSVPFEEEVVDPAQVF